MARILLLSFQETTLFHWGMKSSKDDIHVRSCRRVAPPYNLNLTTWAVLKCVHVPLLSQRMPSSSVAMGHNFYYICWQKVSKLILIFRKLWRRKKNLLEEKYLIHFYHKYNIFELFNDLYHCNMNLWYRFDKINSGDFFFGWKKNFSNYRSTSWPTMHKRFLCPHGFSIEKSVLKVSSGE